MSDKETKQYRKFIPPIVSELGWWFKWQVKQDNILGLDTWALEAYKTRACLATRTPYCCIVLVDSDLIARVLFCDDIVMVFWQL